VCELPEGISFEEGAALSHVGVAAYGALRHGGLKPGETLLVLGTRPAESVRLAFSWARRWALARIDHTRH